MQDVRAFFEPLLAASQATDARQRQTLMQGVAAALGGHRTPPIERPNAELVSLLTRLPRRERATRTIPQAEPPRKLLEAFFPDTGYLPLEGEQLDVMVIDEGGWAVAPVTVLVVRRWRRGERTGWLATLRRVETELD